MKHQIVLGALQSCQSYRHELRDGQQLLLIREGRVWPWPEPPGDVVINAPRLEYPRVSLNQWAGTPSVLRG
jgi:hypothetical protein